MYFWEEVLTGLKNMINSLKKQMYAHVLFKQGGTIRNILKKLGYIPLYCFDWPNQ